MLFLRKIGYRVVFWIYYTLNRVQRFLLPPHASILLTMTNGFVVSRCLSIAAHYNIADKVGKSGSSIETLAAAMDCNPEALYRVMRALSSVGIFKETKERFFINTRQSEACLSDNDNAILAWLKYFSSESQYNMWGKLPLCLRNGKDVFRNLYDSSVFEWYNSNAQDKALFNGAMKNLSLITNKELVDAYPFSGILSVTDIGGGSGALLISILRSHIKVKGKLLDNAEVIQEAQMGISLEEESLKDRITLYEGDFFDFIPKGSDIYIMKSVLHDWEDEKAIRILTKCNEAMPQNSRILIIEMIVGKKNQPQFEKIADIAMLTLSGGKERTLHEFKALYRKANLKINKTYKTSSPFLIMELIKT